MVGDHSLRHALRQTVNVLFIACWVTTTWQHVVIEGLPRLPAKPPSHSTAKTHIQGLHRRCDDRVGGRLRVSECPAVAGPRVRFSLRWPIATIYVYGLMFHTLWAQITHVSSRLSNPLGSEPFTGSFMANAYGLVVAAVRGMISGSRLKNRPTTGS